MSLPSINRVKPLKSRKYGKNSHKIKRNNHGQEKIKYNKSYNPFRDKKNVKNTHQKRSRSEFIEIHQTFDNCEYHSLVRITPKSKETETTQSSIDQQEGDIITYNTNTYRHPITHIPKPDHRRFKVKINTKQKTRRFATSSSFFLKRKKPFGFRCMS